LQLLEFPRQKEPVQSLLRHEIANEGCSSPQKKVGLTKPIPDIAVHEFEAICDTRYHPAGCPTQDRERQ
jgi:hypothetical protein